MKWAVHILNLLLILAAVYAGVTLFYRFAEDRLIGTPPLPAPENPLPLAHNEPPRNFSDYESIARRDLFGTFRNSSPETTPPIDIDSLKPTALSLKLWGTVATDQKTSGRARAVIEDTSTGEQGLYKVGDALQSAIILEIFRNSVVLEVDGQKEKLVIAEDYLSSAEDPAVFEEERPPTTLTRTQIDEALGNVSALMTQAKVKPLFQDGKADGMIISSIEPESFFSRMGFKSGDIITGVNGRKLQSVEDAMAFYRGLAAGSRLSVELIRRGRPTTVDFLIE